MSSVHDQIAAVTPDIERIVNIGGTAGLATGVLHKKEPIPSSHAAL
jgi:hypothetical protein